MTIAVLCFVALLPAVFGQGYIVPEPTFEILRPSGFKVSIPDDGEISLFAFHGNINVEIVNREAGRYSVDIGNPKDGRWTFTDKFARFNKGDVIYYWLYVLHKDGRGYLREGESYTVQESTKLQTDCANTITTASNTDNKLCGGKLIFEDDFVDSIINRQKWTIEQYIAAYNDDNFEFVSYQDVNECRFISDSRLFLKPVAVTPHELRGELDFRGKCTREAPSACYHRQVGAQLLPPVKSGKITSKMSFRHGKIEIRAKLPRGDWIYPQIELIPKYQKYPKILIAYTRGNERLTLENGEDLGSNLLFGGYVTTAQEPQRSQNLRSIRVSASVGQDMHVFSVIWKKDRMDFMLDNNIFGTIEQFDMSGEYRVALGVGVGGVVDFPDDTRSGSFVKPWRNNEAKQMKSFIDAKGSWMGTWRENDVALQVDYVKVYAI